MKKSGRHYLLVAATISLLLAGNANANANTNQTVEGAQRFLAIQAGGSSVEVAGAVHITIHRSHNDGTKDSVIFYANPKISGLSVAGRSGVPDECVTAIGGMDFSSGELSVLRASYVSYSKQALSLPQLIDWRKVSLVRQNDHVSIVTSVPVGSGLTRIWFKTPDKDLLDRIEYAAKFLQMSCDPTANTGF